MCVLPSYISRSSPFHGCNQFDLACGKEHSRYVNFCMAELAKSCLFVMLLDLGVHAQKILYFLVMLLGFLEDNGF